MKKYKKAIKVFLEKIEYIHWGFMPEIKVKYKTNIFEDKEEILPEIRNYRRGRKNERTER